MRKTARISRLQDLAPLLMDHRQQSKVIYPLYEVIMLTIIAMMAGMKEYKQFEIFCHTRQKEIEQHIPLTNGVPTHHTFRAVLSGISPNMLEICYRHWANQQLDEADIQDAFVALDGKTMRGSGSAAKGLSALHVVSAWLNGRNLVLGQCHGTNKDSEIVQIPELIKLLSLKGAIVTIDAMGCQTAIAQTIREAKSEYILAVKENQPTLSEEVIQYFHCADACGYRDISHTRTQTFEFGHGRIEKREYTLIDDLEMLERVHNFKDAHAIGRVVSHCTDKATGKETTAARYYITSLRGEHAIALFAKGVRNHWRIENSCHWCLDYTFKEDNSHILDRNASANMACLRKIILHLLKQDTSIKDSLKNKSLRASLDSILLFRLLFPDCL